MPRRPSSSRPSSTTTRAMSARSRSSGTSATSPPRTPPNGTTAPAPGAGNRLTAREYQTRWLTEFHELASSSGVGRVSAPRLSARASRVAALSARRRHRSARRRLGLPSAELTCSHRHRSTAPHHDYPAWDWGVPTGTPIYAVRGRDDHDCPVLAVQLVGSWLHDSIRGLLDVWNRRLDHRRERGSVGVLPRQRCPRASRGCHHRRNADPHLWQHRPIQRASPPPPDPHRRRRLRCPQPLLESLRDTATGVAPEALPTGGCST